MPTGAKRWIIADRAPEGHLPPNLHPVVAQLLYNRGICEPEAITDFLAGRFETDDPFRMLGMNLAVARVRQAVRAGEPIAVYGDFDADGVTSTALLVLTIRALGGDVRPYIPNRVDEGYGLNSEALSELAGDGVKLVITVDCGIRSPEEVDHAKRLGMHVIITDHHTVGPRLPDAVAVLNPRQPDCEYPYKHLAGVGIAFKLAQALLRANQQQPIQGEISLEEDDLLDLAALGTVADLAPLTGENRSIVMRGLEQINSSPRPGLDALMQQAGVRSGHVDAGAIGYALGPRLNAAGRMDDAEIAYQLLVAEYPGEAQQLADRLDKLNLDRRKLTSELLKLAREMVLESGDDKPLLLVDAPEFQSGVVGLVASRLVEEFYRPAIVVERGDEECRGSARSIPEFHITRALEDSSGLLVRFGGHRVAAGFTVRTELLNELRIRLVAAAERELEGVRLTPALHVDMAVSLQEMGWDLWEQLRQLEPFGVDNPEPLFASTDVQLRYSRPVGADGAHLKLLLFDGRADWDGIAFRQGEWAERLPDRVDIAYHLQVNEWRGERRLQLNVQDIWPSGVSRI